MEFLVSVHILTYNHVNFIKEAVESVLMQDTSFDYDIVIGDDCSTDGTQKVLKELQGKYKDKIRLNLLPEKGKGMPGHVNFVSTLALCKGKYIAFLNGDDYWTDPGKLQMQVDFLEKNPDFAMCHNDCYTPDDLGIMRKQKFNYENPVTGFYEACQLSISFIITVVVRRSILEKFDLKYWLGDLAMGDFPLFALVSSTGKSYFINKKMTHYRKNPKGSLTSTIKYEEYLDSRIRFYKKMLVNNIGNDKKFISKLLSRFLLLKAGYRISRRELGKGIPKLGKSLKYFIKGIGIKKRNYKWIGRIRMKRVLRVFSSNVLTFFKPQDQVGTT